MMDVHIKGWVGLVHSSCSMTFLYLEELKSGIIADMPLNDITSKDPRLNNPIRSKLHTHGVFKLL